MPEGTIRNLIRYFNEAFAQLGVQVALGVVEELAVLIHKAMNLQARNYHNLEHVFSLVSPKQPVQTLAALFHDLIYFQVDRGFLPEIHQIILPYIKEQNEGGIRLVNSIPEGDRLFHLTLDIFEFRFGQVVDPATGMNEFLSARVMNKGLQEVLSEEILLQATLCIEGSIPFRESAASGEDHFYQLESRALAVSGKLDLALAAAEIQQAVRLAVQFANQDVESFADPDVTNFMDTTWKLLPETNEALRSADVYTVRQYRLALMGTESFLSHLPAEKIFHQFCSTPTDVHYKQMILQARSNIDTARFYLQLKLLTQAVLEALAEETGGDAPLSLFMGDLAGQGESTRRLEDFLPDLPPPAWLDPASPIDRLLAVGRREEVGFDLKTAPTTRFIYQVLKPEEIHSSISLARQMFSGKLSYHEFLARMNPQVVRPIARACAEMVFTRREQLLRFAR